jgi:hypothetical protein
MESLTRIIYTSTTAGDIDRESMKRLLSRARGINAALHVSGVLVHMGSKFLHALEGNPDTVDELFARIARDPRHTNVVPLVRESVGQRVFSGLPLGYTTLSPMQMAALSGANEAGITKLCISELNVGRAKRMLNALANSAQRSRQVPQAAAA